ncbi:FadR/GntR family transcriptional regulator [Pseudonocardia eucalypti]|uniref:FadR/GntR family transcriptional regulator n=1 Tax=Pseudonocardia eucalypti TaxID=648755 RepID=A0ABP9R8N6_9PSEU|nr:DNA-binding FadR family transcriptional regulator [Pseudonocardia eucalypti]
MSTPIRRDTVVSTLVTRISEDVLSGRYPPGSSLPPERVLAASYGVTRTSLKHALVQLAQAGLVETKHGVGTLVRDYQELGGLELLPALLRLDPLRWGFEVFQARRQVGALLAAEAARNGTVAQRTRLVEQVAAVRAAENADQAQLAELEFHRELASATGNRVYRLLSNALFAAYLPVRGALQGPFTNPAEAADRLEPLLKALLAGDAKAAHAAAESYLHETERLMLGA